MEKLFRIGETLEMLDTAVSGLGIRVFPTSRPKSVPEHVSEFAVVSLPVSVINMTHGTKDAYGLTRTTCRVDIFVRDKKLVEHVKRLDDLTNGVIGLFPISRDGIVASNPSVVMGGADGFGFHTVTIQAQVITS